MGSRSTQPQTAPIVLAFQMAISATEHDTSSLDWLGKLILRDAKVYHIILTPEGVKSEISASTDYLTAGSWLAVTL